MSSFSRLTTIVLGLSALGCGVLAYQQYYLHQAARDKVGVLEKEITILREKLARQEKSRAERPSWSALSVPGGGPAPLPDSGGDSGGTSIARPEGGFNRMRTVMDSPQAQKFLAMQQKAALDGRYSALFRKLNLSPADLEKFKDLLVERQTSIMDVMAAARNQGMDVRTSGQEISQLIRDAQGEVDNNIRSTLGDTAYQEYKEYEQTLPQRATVGQLEQRLSYTSAPLRPDQVDQLARILADTAPQRPSDTRTAATGFNVPIASSTGGPIPAGMAAAFFGGNSNITDDAVTRAQGVLTSSQLDALKQLQQEQQAQAQLAQEMRGRFGRGPVPINAGATGGPVPVSTPPTPGGG